MDCIQSGFRLALILAFSPREKEKPANGTGFLDERPANPVESISSGRPLLICARMTVGKIRKNKVLAKMAGGDKSIT
jgi:hypothetical protein